MPNAILVEHTVRVVHPSVFWSVMIDGTILLAVGHVERVGILHVLPAGESRHPAIVTICAIDMNVERDVLAVLEFADVEWYIIVDVV